MLPIAGQCFHYQCHQPNLEWYVGLWPRMGDLKNLALCVHAYGCKVGHFCNPHELLLSWTLVNLASTEHLTNSHRTVG